MQRILGAGILIFGSFLVMGCSRGPGRLYPPDYASDAGQVAIKEYDRNGDGTLSAEELNQSPGLKVAMQRIDSDHNGQLTPEEINERIEKWRQAKIGLSGMNARVRLDRVPVQNATVTLIPEKFLGEAVKAASGTTDEQGFARVRISANPDENGVQPGIYRISVSRIVNGKETLPPKFNEKTELGLEIAAETLFDVQNYGIDLRK